jgi:hypothetical protein
MLVYQRVCSVNVGIFLTSLEVAVLNQDNNILDKFYQTNSQVEQV